MAFSDVVEGTNGEALDALQEQVAFLNGKHDSRNNENDKSDKAERQDDGRAKDRDRGDPRQLGQLGQSGLEEISDQTYLLAPDVSQLQLPQDRAKDVRSSIFICLCFFISKKLKMYFIV